ncbi:IF4G [Hepatospora eriocheir]|uniref:IF4G n=1 Tax=Hepatospora eriocheir TaxID=1081669 RepID=A0A1X0Q5S2_9MICR|nr:IF4G [Hepatospora eriocheir]
MVDDIAKDVSVFSSGLEAGDLADSIKKRVNRVKDKKEFWLEYLYVSVTHTKSASKLCELFSRHLVPICKQNLNLTNNFISFLKEFKEEVSSFRDSEPVSKKKYPELLCYLKADKKITDSEFEGLKFDDFNDQIIFLFKKWKSQNDQRLMLFVSKDKFDSI